MKDSWEEVNLFKISQDKPKSFVDGDWIESPYITNEGIRLIQTGNIGIGEFKDRNRKFISKESFKKLNCTEVFPGDILVCRLAEPIGRACIVPDLGQRYITSVDVSILRISDSYSKFYIYQFLNTDKFLKSAELLSGGSTRQRISRINLGNISFKVPPLPQQRKIAEILTTCDTVIAETEAAIAKYEALKQGLMHDLFTRGIDLNTGKLRPTYQKAPELYKETELGWIPKEWEVGKFIDFADPRINRSFTGGPFGSDLQTKHYTKEGVRIIQLQNIGDGHFKNDYKIYTSEERANYLIACNIYPGEIILSKMAEPIARACIIPSYSERYLMASDGIRLSIDKRNYNTRFVLETINQKRFRSIAEVRSTGTTRSRIGLTELKEIPVSYPNLKEQNLIGQRLDTLMRKIENEQKSLEKYQKLKAGLMQDLLSGAVGVEELVEA